MTSSGAGLVRNGGRGGPRAWTRRARFRPAAVAAANRYALERLEPRILFSADLDVLGAVLAPSASDEWTRTIAARADAFAAPAERETGTARSELIIVDAAVPEVESLVERLRAEADDGTTVHLLQPGGNALARIGELIGAHDDIDAVHLISHGDDGILQLGDDVVDTDALLEHADALALWSEHLGDDADILIYGCDVAAGTDGERFVRTLAGLTGADVAASTDVTGHASRGGDWELEHARGAIEANTLASAAVRDDWSGTLARVVYVSNLTSAIEASENISELGQSFTHSSGNGTYKVNEIDLLLARDSGASPRSLTVTLRTSWDGAVLGSATVDASSLGTSLERHTFAFADVELDDGVEYVIQLSRSGPASFYVRSSSDSAYAGGSMLDPGGAPVAGRDLDFRVAVEDPTLSETSYSANRDTYVSLQSNGSNYGSASTTIVASNGSSDGYRATLIGFDIGSLPVGATIEAAYLELESAVPSFYSFDFDLEAKRMIGSWNENTATWDDVGSGVPWSSSFDSATLDSTTLPNGSGGTASLDITALVRDWHGGVVTNHGVTILGSDESKSNEQLIGSREGGSGPSLRVVYSTPSNADPAFVSPSSFLIDENAGSVGTVTSTDADGDVPRYSIVGSADDALFSIDDVSGALTTQPRDFEAPADGDGDNVYDLTVQADDERGGIATQSIRVTVRDVDEHRVSSIDDVDASPDSVPEDATVGTAAGVTASASDADGTDTVSYLLANDAGGRFAINSTTGVVTVAAELDRETASSYPITVEARSTDGFSEFREFIVSIEDVDEFDIGTTIDVDGGTNTVAENASAGTSIGVTASASDDDATDGVTYSLTDDAGGRFRIDAGTGVVTVAPGATFDAETIPSHGITVRSTSDDGSDSAATFTVAVSDVNEFGIGVTSDVDGTTNTVTENASTGAAVGVTASANDDDATDGVTYSLTDDAGGRFRIDAVTGVVTVAPGAVLDAEMSASHAIEVRSTSDDGSNSAATFTIAVGDVNEFGIGATTDADSGTNTVAENASVGAAVGVTASANDDDATDGVTYSLTDDADGRFLIDATTGVVRVASGAVFDVETIPSHDIAVRSTSDDGSNSNETFVIAVSDVNESSIGATSDVDGGPNTVAENASAGATVGVTASANDDDATDGVTYSLTDDAGGRFRIDAGTGVVTVAPGATFDAETIPSHGITVRSTSDDGSDSAATFTVAVSDVNEFGIGVTSDVDGTTNTVTENASTGATVGVTASANDDDATDGVTYSLTDDADGRFLINATTGVVTVAPGVTLDAESNATHEIEVLSTSGDSSTSSETFTIAVDDVNESGVGATTDADSGANTVAENVPAGATVGVTASASDDDATDGVTYSLTDDADGRFQIDAVTGVVTVAPGAVLDAEMAASHAIEVRSTSDDGSDSTQTFTISVGDVNESGIGATTDADSGTNTVAENASGGTAVGVTASASDDDATDGVTYSLTDDAGGRFRIDAGTGVVMIAPGAILDAESIHSHDITVRSTSDDSSTSDKTFTIAVDDVNEFGIGVTTDVDGTTNTVAEDASVGTSVGVTASASDDDATDGVTYSLTDDADGRFQIDAVTGVVTVAPGAVLDTEMAASHAIEVRSTSDDGSDSAATFTIAVGDVNEFGIGTTTDVDGGPDTVAENASSGTSVGVTASASDDDATDDVTYSLTDDADGRFQIDAVTGVVTVAPGAVLDTEVAASHAIEVRSTSDDGSDSTETFTISVSDVNESGISETTDVDGGTNTVAENASAGTEVGITTSATDDDATDGVTYSLTDDADGRFQIDAVTGVVTVAPGAVLDAEMAASHAIEVRSTSDDGSNSAATFTIAVGDVNEFGIGATTDADSGTNTVAENASTGTEVGITASASDADATDGVTYSLTDDAGGRLLIDATTGVVTVAPGMTLDAESNATHEIEVLSTSGDSSTSSETFTIAVDDVNEFGIGVTTDVDGGPNTVTENASSGATVGVTASATDDDATDNVTYSLTDDAGGRFRIDAGTGVVTVAPGATFDAETIPSHGITVRSTSDDGSDSAATFTVAVSDVNEFGIGVTSDVDGTTNTVTENASTGAAVGVTASANDDDATDGVTYSLTDDAGGRFRIDAVTGVVTVAPGAVLDAEMATSHAIEVRSTSDDGSDSAATFTIAVGDVNESGISETTDVDGGTNTVTENASSGTEVGITASANDDDATDGVTYSLTDDADGRFRIDATTGVVTVAAGAAFDAETVVSYDITVRSVSDDGSNSTETFNIAVADVNEFGVGETIDVDGTTNTVAEDAPAGTEIGITTSASDDDATDGVTYSLTDDAGGRFQIDAVTGVVTVAPGAVLDAEMAASHAIEVLSTSDDGSTSGETFTIAVGDVNEFGISTTTDVDSGPNAVVENASAGTAVGVTASANDDDATDGVTYSLTDDAGGRFLIDATTGVVTVALGVTLDAESNATHEIEVLSTSGDSSTSSEAFTIAVDDVNESGIGATTDADSGANTVAENASSGTAVGVTAAANDDDATDNVTYSLTDDAGGRFLVNATTGVVTVAPGVTLDAESNATHDIKVLSTSGDSSTSIETFTIAVSDVNESSIGATSDVDGGPNTVAENASSGTAVGVTASATDDDATDGVTYSLTDDAGGRFLINATAGVVTVAPGVTLDAESNATHEIEVLSTSGDSSTSSETFTITVDDVNESGVGATTDADSGANTVAENVPAGATVGVTASASDDDATDGVTYSLTDDADGRFQIDAVTGVVTVAPGAVLDAEMAASHAIEVRSTSDDGSDSAATFTIAVGDVNESGIGVTTDADSGPDTVAENASAGTAVGVTASASDDDATDSVTYSLTDDAVDRFQIDAVTGAVTVAPGAVLDAEVAASHAIEVLSRSDDGSTSGETFTITVADVNESGIGVTTDADSGTNTVAENASSGAAVGITASANDNDATDGVTYSLTDDADGRFLIDATTGVVTVAPGVTLDAESNATHEIEVLSTSGDSSTSSETFTIAVDDVNEFGIGVTTDVDGTTNTVIENASSSATVGVTASATDDDATDGVIYSLTDDASGRFQIDAVTGAVTVAPGAVLDAEVAASHAIEVRSTSDDGSDSTETFTIAVGDVNEFGIGTTTDVDGGPDTVVENASAGTTVGVTASANDDDATDGVTYALTDDAGGRFRIDATTGMVTVASGAVFDVETTLSHDITVRSASDDGSKSNETFTISVSDVNESSIGATSDVDGGPNTVAENASAGTSVGVTASASDDDATDGVTYSLTDDAGGRFQIDAVTGAVTVAPGAVLDVEMATSHAIEVHSTSDDGSDSTQTFTIAVGDVNEFGIGATIDADSGTNTVAENASAGTEIGITTSANDDDATDGVTYSLTDDAGGRFRIDAVTGVVTVAPGAVLDAEMATSHAIEVRSTSDDGSDSAATFTISVGDVNESGIGATSDVDGGPNTVAENASSGTAVGVTASATDDDATDNVTYSLTDDADGRFLIDATTGVVTVAPGVTLDAESNATHEIEVLSTSGDSSTSSETFTIAVDDVNEFGIGVTTDVDGTTNTVTENASSSATVGVTASATDDDATDNVTYSLTDDADGRFLIDAATGVVMVASGAAFDVETTPSHDITVRSTSDDGSTSNETFVIAVSDVNESSIGATSDVDGGPNTVAENASAGTSVGVTASASDDDATDGVAYSLTDDADGRFQIDAVTGVVTVAPGAVLDAEMAASHAIAVRSTSDDGSTSSETFTVTVDDVNESRVSATSDVDGGPDTVAENASAGTAVGITASASDDDATDGVTYALTDDAGGRFRIDAGTGVVTIAPGAVLDAEVTASHDIEVLSTSGDGSTSSESFTIAVDDVNESDIGIVVDIDDGTNTITENAPAGTTVGIVASAFDDDREDTVTYSLTDDAGGRFAIDAATGVVTVATTGPGNIDHESGASHAISVRATSSDGSDSIRQFTILVDDVDEFAISPVTDADERENAVPEGTPVGAGVGITASAFDRDGTDAVAYSLDGDAGGRFTIDADSGEVSIARDLDHEQETSHTILVRAQSSDGTSTVRAFEIEVEDVNEAPALETLEIDAVSGGGVIATIVARDPDAGDDVRFALLEGDRSDLFSLDAESGRLSLLGEAPAGTYELRVAVTDDGGASSVETLRVRILDDGAAAALGVEPVAGQERIGANLDAAVLPEPGFGAGTASPSKPVATDIVEEVEGEADAVLHADSSGEAETVPGGVSGPVPDRSPSWNSFDESRRHDDAGSRMGVHGESGVSEQPGRDRLVLDLLTGMVDRNEVSLSATIDALFEDRLDEAGLSPRLTEALQDLKSELEQMSETEREEQALVRTLTATVGTSVAVGFVGWLLTSGLLAAATTATASAWHSFDPIPVAGRAPAPGGHDGMERAG